MVLTAQRQRTKTITDYRQIEKKITDYRQEKYQADLATKRKRHLTTGKRTVPNQPLCHLLNQSFDLRAPSSTDVAVVLLNEPINRLPTWVDIIDICFQKKEHFVFFSSRQEVTSFKFVTYQMVQRKEFHVDTGTLLQRISKSQKSHP